MWKKTRFKIVKTNLKNKDLAIQRIASVLASVPVFKHWRTDKESAPLFRYSDILKGDIGLKGL
jgi:hypothetical protein